MAKILLPWGKDEQVRVVLPAGWEYMGEMVPEPVEIPSDRFALLDAALKSPFGFEPLSKMKLSGKKIAVVIDDLTRPTPVSLLFPQVLKELERAGATTEAVTVVIALGMHRPMTDTEISERLGMADPWPFAVVNHDCLDPSMNLSVGKDAAGREIRLNRHLAGADLIVLIGTIEPHLIAGFGGGLKNIIPGCADMGTIASTHLLGDPQERFFVVGKLGEEVPTRRAIEAGALLLSTPIFLVNTVLNDEGGIAGIFCGDPVQAHREGCKRAERVYGVHTAERFDVLLLDSHPMDIDFRQGTKCLCNGLTAAKDEALLIGFLRCEQGLGDMSLPERFLPTCLTRRFAQEIGAERLVEIRDELRGPLSLDEKYMLQFLCEIARRHPVLLYAPELPADAENSLGAFELYSDLEALMARAAELAPGRRTVASMPFGGIHYPVLHHHSLKREE